MENQHSPCLKSKGRTDQRKQQCKIRAVNVSNRCFLKSGCGKSHYINLCTYTHTHTRTWHLSIRYGWPLSYFLWVSVNEFLTHKKWGQRLHRLFIYFVFVHFNCTFEIAIWPFECQNVYSKTAKVTIWIAIISSGLQSARKWKWVCKNKISCQRQQNNLLSW